MVVHKGTSCESFKRGYVRKNGKNADSYIFVAIYVEWHIRLFIDRPFVIIALSRTIFELFDIGIWVKCYSRSLKLVPFESFDAVSYSPVGRKPPYSCCP